jgi:hypothetical protein
MLSYWLQTVSKPFQRRHSFAKYFLLANVTIPRNGIVYMDEVMSSESLKSPWMPTYSQIISKFMEGYYAS